MSVVIVSEYFPVEMREQREMKTIRSCWRKHKTAIILTAVSLVICGVLLFFFGKRIIQGLNFSQLIFEEGRESDDQRSTMWPMIVSLTVTMLGSIITTYVFSKDTLDRILDERPYYHEVIAKYRRKTMNRMFGYIGVAAISIFSVFVLYFFYYFRKMRFPECLRVIVLLICLFVGILSVYLLCQCIHSERRLQKDAKTLLKNMMRQTKGYTRCVRADIWLPGVRPDALALWLQIEAEHGTGQISYRKFISVFSKWEELLVLLAQQQAENSPANMTLDQQIEFTIRTGLDAYRKSGTSDSEPDSFEWTDARENNWLFTACEKVITCEKALERSARTLPSSQRLGGAKSSGRDAHPSALDCFMDEYRFLARCRDLCKIIMDGMEEDMQKEGSDLFGDIIDGRRDIDSEKNLANIFYLFLAGLFTQALRTAPTIKLFFPAGLFTAADFYNIRFNDSLFRSSNFQHSIFARAKIKDSNFSLSRFEQCNLYSADCRDCTFTNTYWTGCFLENVFLENADFTGAELDQCCLRGARFHNVILQNLHLSNPMMLGGNDFLNSRLEKIDLVFPWRFGRINIRNCNFSNSILSEIIWRPRGWLAPFSSRFASLKAEMDCPELREYLFSGVTKQRNIFLKKMDAFSPPQDLFPLSAVAAQGHGGHPVWSDIEKGTVILMNDSVFENATLVAPYFYRVSLEQSVLTRVQMDNALFFGTNMFGCIMPEANLLGSRLWAVILQSTVLTDAIFFRAYCKLVNFEDAALRDFHASEAKLYDCSFSRSDCSRIDLTRAAIRNCAFIDSILIGAELTGAEFRFVRFDNSVANSMLATSTKFKHCQLRSAGLSGSSFNSAAFEDCDFCLADCSDSVVANTTFKRCSFAGCNFKNTRFVNVKIEDCSCLDTAEFEGALFINLELKGTNRMLERENVFPKARFKKI